MERAKGTLSEMHNVPESDSLKLLIEISRGSRRDLRDVPRWLFPPAFKTGA